MGELHVLGTMADPEQLLDALHALGAIRAPSAQEREQIAHEAASRELWRLECAQHLAGVLETQLLMATTAAADTADPHTQQTAAPILLAGWEWFAGGVADQDDARVALLVALTARLNELLMLLVARLRNSHGEGVLSPLLMPSLAIASSLQTLLTAAHQETADGDDPRRELSQIVENLRATADVLESMTPRQHRSASARPA